MTTKKKTHYCAECASYRRAWTDAEAENDRLLALVQDTRDMTTVAGPWRTSVVLETTEHVIRAIDAMAALDKGTPRGDVLELAAKLVRMAR
jgi:NMD protein affecting ribosome stability and mRNA decay